MRRYHKGLILATLVATSFCFGQMLMTTAESLRINGDLNLDQAVNIDDVILLNLYLAETGTKITQEGLENADCNHDGLLTVFDSTRILRWLAGFLTDEEFFGVPQETTTTTTTSLTEETTTTTQPIYDTSGFAYQWPEVFSVDDTVTITENSYQSHDVNISISSHISDNLAYYVADIYVRDLNCFRSAFAGGSFAEPRSGQTDSVRNMAAENNAILAMNADYYEIRSNGIIYRNGILYRDVVRGDLAVVYRDGNMDVMTNGTFQQLTTNDRENIWHTMCFGPALVMDSVPITSFSTNIAVENPRSGIGFYEPGHYCFVQVDGRQEGYSMGLTLEEYAALFQTLGCKEAFNLDGGQSSEIVFNGQRVNQPYGGGRYSSDIIYICENPTVEG